MPLTRYPKKKPEEQMRNCCHFGRSVNPIPNRARACSSPPFPIPLSLSLPFSLYPHRWILKKRGMGKERAREGALLRMRGKSRKARCLEGIIRAGGSNEEDD